MLSMRRRMSAAVQVASGARGYMLTSQDKKTQFPHQFVVPASVASKSYRVPLRSRYGRTEAAPLSTTTSGAAADPEEVQWENADGVTSTGADVLAVSEVIGASSQTVTAAQSRTYVPLADVVKIELRGDYLTEAGRGQEALEHYGVAMAGYEAAYPPFHNQIAKMRVKLARSLRMTNRLSSAVQSGEEALRVLDNVARPFVETAVEALLELGEAHAAKGDLREAATVFEDAYLVVEAQHDMGASHRGLRQLKQLSRRLHIGMASKFTWHSPYSYDRVFALADTALTRAEQCNEALKDAAAVVRVLEYRSHMNDRKYFNMRDYAFRIRTWRGKNVSKGKSISARPSATELLAYTPTVHQPYFDYSALSTAPLGKEHLVSVGANAKELDDGDPTRHMVAQEMQRKRLNEVGFERVRGHWQKPLRTE